MRKLILISALLLASPCASAQAGDSHEILLAAADAPPPAISTDMSHPLPPVAKAAKNDKDESAKPQADERAAAQARAAKLRSQARYGSDEAKARRIAARYGYSW